MSVIDVRGGYSLSGAVASGAGSAFDCRNCADYAYWMYVCAGGSANLAFQISHDGTGWMQHLLVTGTTTTGTGIFSAFFPYVRVNVNVRYAGATAYAVYVPGYK